MVSGISSSNSYASQMMIQAMQQRKNEMFAKVDTNGSGGVDKTELASLTDKISANTGNTLNVEDIFSAYNTDGDDTLSTEELNAFMKDNAPKPPEGMEGMMGMGGMMGGASMRPSQDELFSKVDTDGDGGINSTELADLTKKIAEKTGNDINTDDVMSTYDNDGDGALSKDELGTFMKDNAPPPPSGHQMQKAMSAYSSADKQDQVSSLIDYLEQSNSDNESGGTNISSDYLEKIIEALKNSIVNSATSSSGQGTMLDFEV